MRARPNNLFLSAELWTEVEWRKGGRGGGTNSIDEEDRG